MHLLCNIDCCATEALFATKRSTLKVQDTTDYECLTIFEYYSNFDKFAPESQSNCFGPH